jgi:hypothetical protein
LQKLVDRYLVLTQKTNVPLNHLAPYSTQGGLVSVCVPVAVMLAGDLFDNIGENAG